MFTVTDNLSGTRAADLAAITYRQLDYWSRLGVIRANREANGSGTRRSYTRHQVAVLAVLGHTGAHLPISRLDSLAQHLSDLPLDRWDEPGRLLLVDADGGVWLPGEDAPPVAVAVQPDLILRQVAERAARAGVPYDVG